MLLSVRTPSSPSSFMFRLIATTAGQKIAAQFSLAAGTAPLQLGRSPQADLQTPWDQRISGLHLELQPEGSALRLIRLPTATNPVFVDGREVTSALLQSGQSFIIGTTSFELQLNIRSDSSQPPAEGIRQLTIERQSLEQVRFNDAARRIEVLTSLPTVIREAAVDRELSLQLTTMLLAGISDADLAAVVGLTQQSQPRIFHAEHRFDAATAVAPSSRLVAAAMQQQKTVLHIWDEAAPNAEYTQAQGFGWAFCTPFADLAGDRGLYISGRGSIEPGQSSEQRLQGDIRFAELIADIVTALQKQRRMERQQSGLRQFFSPPVLEALGRDLDTSLLEPRECDVTVLFCDLRGFSHRAEEQADNLTGLLERVSLALEVMTSQILRFGGVTGDFQGDAALGFWGWPLESAEAPLNACRAALAIREEFSKAQADPAHPLRDFETSIGISYGRAVAGKIGTREQVKVTVFGPVVNLASRLEAMTRELHVSVLIDERLDQLVRGRMAPGDGRVRRLLKVQPYGLDKPLFVSELVPPVERFPLLTDQHLADFEAGLQAFMEGRWSQAWSFLHRMPAEDRAQDFLSMLITQHDRRAPPGWDGIVRMKKKSGA